MLDLIFFPQPPPLNHSIEKEWPPLKIIIVHPLGKLWMLPCIQVGPLKMKVSPVKETKLTTLGFSSQSLVEFETRWNREW